MLADGDVKKYSKTENSDAFPAFLCSLGALGILITATIQCEDSFKLHNSQYGAQLNDVNKF